MINSLNRLRCGFFTKQIRRCFSDYDNDLNVFDDDIGTDSIASSTSKINYTFYKKSFAFVVDNPLFTTKTTTLSIGKRKMSFLKSAKSYFDNETIFATTLLPRIDLAKTQFTDTNDFYPIGSYCAVNILDNSTISLKALHKTNIEKVYTLDLPREDNKRENNMFNSMGVDKGKYFDQLDKYKDIDMDSLRKKDEPSLLNIETPDHLIHLCDSNQIDTQDGFELSLTTRVKIDYLIEFYRKIIPTRSNENLNFIVNYHDIEGFIDHLGILFVDMKFFKYEELVGLFACKDVEEAVNIAFSLMKRYFLFTNKMQDIGKIAES